MLLVQFYTYDMVQASEQTDWTFCEHKVVLATSNHRHTTFSEHDMIQDNYFICIDTNFSEHDTIHTNVIAEIKRFLNTIPFKHEVTEINALWIRYPSHMWSQRLNVLWTRKCSNMCSQRLNVLWTLYRSNMWSLRLKVLWTRYRSNMW